MHKLRFSQESFFNLGGLLFLEGGNKKKTMSIISFVAICMAVFSLGAANGHVRGH